MSLSSIYQSIAEGVMAVDKRGNIIFLNTKAEAIFGIEKDYAVGKKIIECFSARPENDDFLNTVIDVIFSKEERITREVSFYNGKEQYSLYMSSVYISNEVFTGIIIVFSDITELANLKTLEKNLKRKQTINSQLSRQNEILGKAFENYMDDSVVDELLFSNASSSSGMKQEKITLLMIMSPVIQGHIDCMSPKDYIKMLNHYMDAVISVIKENKGAVVELHSDGILATFGAPAQIKDHADCALRSALEIQRMISGLNDWNTLHSYPEISLKIGLHTDEMYVGVIGGSGALKYNVFGKAINLTARMTVTAKNGEIVISDQTRSTLQGEYDIYDDYQVIPKGLSEPLNIHKVRGHYAD